MRVFPAELAARYFDWVDNMHDWCISRQLWWGHRIPVWYGPEGQVRCASAPPRSRPLGRGAGTQDPDVLDTWFSSALWPFSTLGWPDDTADLRTFYPDNTRAGGPATTSSFFWVARMMLFGLYANAGLGPEQSVPFRQIALHGLVRDQFGKKMSKSRGNTVDPLAWIDRFGADATRFILARGATPGGDIAVSEDWVAGARNFCNKLWNAARFALMNGAVADAGLPAPAQLTAADRWILSRLAAVTAQVDEYFAQYEFAKACEALYHFAWDEFCDWYLELAKTGAERRRRGGDPSRRSGLAAWCSGVDTLDRLLRLLHPFLPFLTDELWTALTGGESVVIARWPGALAPGTPAAPGQSGAGQSGAGQSGAGASEPAADPAAEAEIGALMRLVTEVRRFRSDQGVRPGQPVPAVLAGHRRRRRWPRTSSPDPRAAPGSTEPAEPGFAPTASVQAEGVNDRTGHRGRPGRRGRAPPGREGPGRRPGGHRGHRAQAREPVVPRAGARGGGGQERGPAGRRAQRGPPLPGNERLAEAHDRGKVLPRSTVMLREYRGGGWTVPLTMTGVPLRWPTSAAEFRPRSSARSSLRQATRALHRPDAGPDSGAGRRARRPAEGLPGHPPDRDQRQDVHGPDDRAAAACPRPAHRPVHQPAPDLHPRADLRRRRAAVRRAVHRPPTRRSSPYLWTRGRRRASRSRLSFFEVLVGMAFATFADARVDVAVIEVGLGGRWDNTNVADGTVAVLTPISVDHVRWLGGTGRASPPRRPAGSSSQRRRGPRPAAARCCSILLCCAARPRSARRSPARAWSSACSAASWPSAASASMSAACSATTTICSSRCSAPTRPATWPARSPRSRLLPSGRRHRTPRPAAAIRPASSRPGRPDSRGAGPGAPQRPR